MGFLQVKTEPYAVVYLYATALGSVERAMSWKAEQVKRGTLSRDGKGIIADSEGYVRVEDTWITDGTWALAVAFKTRRKVGVATVKGNANWVECKLDKLGMRGPLGHLVRLKV